MSARSCALEALCEWEDTSRFASEILDEISSQRKLNPADRALALELLYGTIRNLFLLDEVIERFRKGQIKNSTLNILRLGIFQLYLTEIAEHAAVNETVNLAKKHERKFVNAILRNAQRSKDSLKSEIESWPLEDRYSHPTFLLERWEEQYSEASVRQLCQWNNTQPEVFARINNAHPDTSAIERLTSEVADARLEAPFENFFRVDGAPNPDWLSSGLIYIQDPSTTLSCRLLAPQPGEHVLDACAAPGGKTALLAEMMDHQGTIVATDSSGSRLRQLRENLERLQIEPVVVEQVDWINSTDHERKYDAVLLDAPCSNSGVMRRRVDVRWRLQPWDFDRQVKTQKCLLESVARVVKPGGRIVYSTCSIDSEENEQVIRDSGLDIVKIRTSLPWVDGFDGAFAALIKV